MIIQKVPHYVDSVLTQEVASAALQGGDVVVAWYTNQFNSQSVVHSHPYYELDFAGGGQQCPLFRRRQRLRFTPG